MKVRTNRIYPYPVLSESSNDYTDNTFSVERELEYDSESATISINTTINDEKMLRLINEDKVSYCCLIECSNTKYRELFSVPKNQLFSYQFTIPLSQIIDSVEVVCLLIANDEIVSSNDNFNELFFDTQVRFPKHSIIGFSDTDEFKVIKQLDASGDIPSIFSIVQSETDDRMTFDASDCQISVFLPKDIYELYKDYKGIGKRIKQMMTVLPVLIEIIDEIKEDSTSYEGKTWFSVLESAFEKCGFSDCSSDAFKNKPSVELAQMLLGPILNDAFLEFDLLNKKGD